MNSFVRRFAPLVSWILSGFDRLVFRGTLLPLVRERGMHVLLARSGVRLLDFKDYAIWTSDQLKQAALAEAERTGRPVVYLNSPRTSKEDLARKILAEQPLRRAGLICMFKAVEPCMSFEYHRSQDPADRGLRLRPRKCLHLYRYALHPTFGFMNARIQTWFPFNIQICLNGREWLARDLGHRRLGFERADNCFTRLGNPSLAQRLMDGQLNTDWATTLSAVARSVNPLHDEIFAWWPMSYYWSGYQTEWATDILFRSPQALAELYPVLVQHAMTHFKSEDVMRFLGRKLRGNFTGELTTSFKKRPEGVRVKHWVRGNSIKMYDKAGCILRVETTIARTNDFKVYRPPHDDPDGKEEWKPLRKGVADLHRRADVSQRSNDRYLDALALVDDTTPCSKIFDDVSQPVTHQSRRFRALRLNDPGDIALLEAISRGEYATAGFRNRDIRGMLYPKTREGSETRRLSARVSRSLRLLRAHGVIRKIPKTHRYMLTNRGQLLTAALWATRAANLKELIREAA